MKPKRRINFLFFFLYRNLFHTLLYAKNLHCYLLVPMSNRDRIQLLLKEWELCQDNMKRHNQWFWQSGSMFIAISLAALWAFSQVNETIKLQWFIIFATFSVSTILIWFVFIARRAMRFSEISREVIREIEQELASDLSIRKTLLHTRIQDRDKFSIFRAKHGVYFFIILTIGIWVITYHILFAL